MAETSAIPSPVNSLAHTFLHPQVTSPNGRDDRQSMEIWLGATNEVLLMLQGHDGVSEGQTGVVWIVEHTDLAAATERPTCSERRLT